MRAVKSIRSYFAVAIAPANIDDALDRCNCVARQSMSRPTHVETAYIATKLTHRRSDIGKKDSTRIACRPGDTLLCANVFRTWDTYHVLLARCTYRFLHNDAFDCTETLIFNYGAARSMRARSVR